MDEEVTVKSQENGRKQNHTVNSNESKKHKRRRKRKHIRKFSTTTAKHVNNRKDDNRSATSHSGAAISEEIHNLSSNSTDGTNSDKASLKILINTYQNKSLLRNLSNFEAKTSSTESASPSNKVLNVLNLNAATAFTELDAYRRPSSAPVHTGNTHARYGSYREEEPSASVPQTIIPSRIGQRFGLRSAKSYGRAIVGENIENKNIHQTINKCQQTNEVETRAEPLFVGQNTLHIKTMELQTIEKKPPRPPLVKFSKRSEAKLTTVIANNYLIVSVDTGQLRPKPASAPTLRPVLAQESRQIDAKARKMVPSILKTRVTVQDDAQSRDNDVKHPINVKPDELGKRRKTVTFIGVPDT